jgi:phosphoenolpyruvate carboxykinase (GTP)
MDSGKSTLALQTAHNHQSRGRTGLIFTSKDRAGSGVISSRLGLQSPAIEVDPNLDIHRYVVDHLSIGERIAGLGGNLPKIFCVNWFRKNDDGKFVWPGYGENMRVLAWILGRVNQTSQAQENIFGYSPNYEDINWQGIEFSEEQFNQVISVNKESWREELKLHDELFDQLAYGLPPVLRDTKAKLENLLA